MPAVAKASFLDVRAIGAIGRIIQNGQHVELNDVEKIAIQLERLKAVRHAPQVVAEVKAAPTTTIQDRIADSARTHAAEFDGAIDEFFTTKKTDFTAKAYLLSNQVSGAVAKKIGELYKPMLEELLEVQAGKDTQLKEGYSNLSRIELRRVIAFVQSIVDDCQQQIVSAKAQRKPRARKVKPPSVIASKVKYMREYAELKLKSIEPAKIIGASELWVYAPEKRKLTVYRGADGGYLGVSGTSITNYDTKLSEVKTIRKPEEFFKGLSFGKRAMANAWKAIKSKATSPRSRINDEMILLAVN